MSQSPPRLLVAEALVAAGQLRECVAAVRNLEHLVASLTVGRQVLAHVIVDVAHALTDFSVVIEGALKCCRQAGMLLSSDEQDALVGPPQQCVEALLKALSQSVSSPIHAKSRLALERRLARDVPVIVAAVAHLDLLLDIVQAESTDMSVLELLTSMPQRGSQRPHRPVSIRGDGLASIVSIPPRVGVGILSVWVSAVAAGINVPKREAEDLGLVIRKREEEVEFACETHVFSNLVVRLPVFFPSKQSRVLLDVSLRPFGGRASGDTLVLSARDA